jgi:dephospho-CoA kinase
MLRIGVTGLMASGKSTVARRFEERGAVRIDGDALGQETIRTPEIRRAIAAEFGPSVIGPGPDSVVDRARLGAIVFRDTIAMERLNRIVQPVLLERVRRELETASAGPVGVVVLDAALISTWKLERELDGVVLVTAPEALRIRRLALARGFDDEEARARVRGQTLAPLAGAKHVWTIENAGDVSALEAAADRIWGEIIGRRQGPAAGNAR